MIFIDTAFAEWLAPCSCCFCCCRRLVNKVNHNVHVMPLPGVFPPPLTLPLTFKKSGSEKAHFSLSFMFHYSSDNKLNSRFETSYASILQCFCLIRFNSLTAYKDIQSFERQLNQCPEFEAFRSLLITAILSYWCSLLAYRNSLQVVRMA